MSVKKLTKIDIEKPGHSPDWVGESESRKLPRLSFASVQFRSTVNGKIFSVHDLAMIGMSLKIVDSKDLFAYPVTTEIRGVINLSGEKYPIRGTVIHIRSDRVGCAFKELQPDTLKALEDYLSPVSIGKKLRPIPISESGALWFSGPADTHLFVWRTRDGEFKKCILFLLGNYIQWDLDRGFVTGKSELEGECAEEWGILHYENFRLEPEAVLDQEKLNLAKTLVLSSNLPQEIKNWLEFQLKERESRIKNR